MKNNEHDQFKLIDNYDWNGFGRVNSEWENSDIIKYQIKVNNEGTSDDLDRYLNYSIKSEVILNNNVQEKFNFAKFSRGSKSEDISIDKVNLDYIGNKHMFEKGENAERRDVLYKNFIRAIRRYLWVLFENEFDISMLPLYRPSKLFNEYIWSFYEKYFKPFVSDEITLNQQTEDEICFIVATILTNKYSFPSKTKKHRKFIDLFESIRSKFTKATYERFFRINNVPEVFNILLKSGLVDKIINVYPKLSDSKESYLRVAQNIANFKETRTLIK